MFGLRRRRSSTATSKFPERSVSVVTSSCCEEEDEDRRIEHIDITGGEGVSWRNILTFESLNLQSTSWRNELMLASMKEEDGASSTISYISHYGVDVCFIPKKFHYTVTELQPYRQIGDPEMDALLDYLSQNRECGVGAFDDVVGHIAKEYHQCTTQGSHPSLAYQFYKHYYEKVPSWVDFDQIQRGIDVFLAYLPVAGCSLFYRSLVGGFSIPQIVEVLTATRYLVPSQNMGGNSARSINNDRKRSEERLIDTGGFLACCFAPPASSTDHNHNVQSVSDCKVKQSAALRPGGKGWAAALKVRVLHAKVRRALLKSTKTKWDAEKNGIPINQQDMAATLLAFSVNVLLGIEMVLGRSLPESEQRDYLALWRYLGWLLGVDTVETEDYSEKSGSSNASKDNNLIPIDPCGPRKLYDADRKDTYNLNLDCMASNDSIIHAYATLESMILHLLHPNDQARNLVTHLLRLRRFFLFRSEVCRKFLGNPLSDRLAILRSTIEWKGLRRESFTNLITHAAVKFFLYFFLLFLRCYTLVTISFPCIRKRAIRWHGFLQTKFLNGWERMNAKRMNKAVGPAARKLTMQEDKSICPFSMVMSPSEAVQCSTIAMRKD